MMINGLPRHSFALFNHFLMILSESELPFDGLYLANRPWFPYVCTEVEHWQWQSVEGRSHYNFWAVLEGDGYLNVGEQTFRLCPGMFFIFSPEQQISAVHYSGPRITRFSAHFIPLSGATIMDAVPTFPVLGGDVGSVALFKRQIDVIMRMAVSKADDELLHRLMHGLIQRVCSTKDSRADVLLHPKVAEAIQLIRATPGTIESMDMIARQLGWSRSHFDRVFAQQVGQAPKQFLLNCKMIEARRYLESSTLRIGEIAEALGYRDIYFFSRQFKQFFGLPPLAYRQSLHHD
jgi:AraC family transcriptional regulator, arabinose operon regulatory protein